MWYFMVIGVQAMAVTFPFSQAMTLSRREYYLGTLGAAAASAAGMSAVFVVLGLVEQATNGYGMNAYFAYLDPLWEHGPLAAWVEYLVVAMLAFVLGFWATTIYRLGGVPALVGVGLGALGAILLFVAVVTWREWWPNVGRWIVDTGAPGIAAWLVPLLLVLMAGSYLTLRRLPAA